MKEHAGLIDSRDFTRSLRRVPETYLSIPSFASNAASAEHRAHPQTVQALRNENLFKIDQVSHNHPLKKASG